jgi:hypothetical protein
MAHVPPATVHWPDRSERGSLMKLNYAPVQSLVISLIGCPAITLCFDSVSPTLRPQNRQSPFHMRPDGRPLILAELSDFNLDPGILLSSAQGRSVALL